jgi:hypothetical protein
VGRADPLGAAGTARAVDSGAAIDLRLWSLATFRTVTFTIAAALVTHLRGSLASSLARLDTAIGFALFVVLWATTACATRIGLRHERRAEANDGLESTLEATIVAGGWNGVFILIASASVFVAPLMLGPAALVVPFALLIASVVAFGFGGVFGLVYGLVEILVCAISDRLVAYIDGPTRAPESLWSGTTHGVR